MSIQVYTDNGIADIKSLFFPGGEPHVQFVKPREIIGEVQIDARIGSMNDFVMLLAITNALKELHVDSISLLLPYFPGARQDKREDGFCFTAKMFADIINSQGYGEVLIVDPHSEVVPALVRNCVVLGHKQIIARFAHGKVLDGLICPDAGAEKRVREVAKYLKLDAIVYARKQRDVFTGELRGFHVENPPVEGTFLVVDDICDGGGTFIGLAQAIKEHSAGRIGPSLHLWTTHGIYSKGIESLLLHYETIGCTDSFPGPRFEDKRFQKFGLAEASK